MIIGYTFDLVLILSKNDFSIFTKPSRGKVVYLKLQLDYFASPEICKNIVFKVV